MCLSFPHPSFTDYGNRFINFFLTAHLQCVPQRNLKLWPKLKIAETTYLPVRSYGLEEFLHEPRFVFDRQTSLLMFLSFSEPRRKSLMNYTRTIGSEVIDIHDNLFRVPDEFKWLCQLVWGQFFALEMSKKLGINPDTVRIKQHPYQKAEDFLPGSLKKSHTDLKILLPDFY